MEQERTLLVGMDLGYDRVQVAVYQRKKMEVVPVKLEQGAEWMPMAIGVRHRDKELLFGREALAQKEEGLLLNHLLSTAMSRKEVEIFQTQVALSDLLEQIFRRILLYVKQAYPGELIRCLVISIPKLQRELVQVITQGMEKVGIHKDRLVVESHGQSFQYYALHQSKELWSSNVGLLDYSREGLRYDQITLNRRRRPALAILRSTDYSAALGEPKGKNFLDIANKALYKQQVTTLYATGEEMEGEWCKAPLTSLCQGRRVFLGQNLYTQGACLHARELENGRTGEEILYITEDMTTETILLRAFYQGKMEQVILGQAGVNWMEVNKEVDVILDEGDRIRLNIFNAMTNGETTRELYLEGLEKRPRKMTRLGLHLFYKERDSWELEVTDLGFGEYYPASGKSWKITGGEE